MTPDNGLECGFATIRNDFGKDLGLALENSKDDGLPSSSASSFPSNPMRPEVGFVNLDLPLEGRLTFALLSHALTNPKEDGIH